MNLSFKKHAIQKSFPQNHVFRYFPSSSQTFYEKGFISKRNFKMNRLIRYYIRYMNKNRPKGNTMTVISSTFTTKTNKSKENYPVQTNKTERKSSLGTRAGLSELPINNFQYSSNWKGENYRAPRQTSIQMPANQSRIESSGVRGSRWLDNDKEMMEFILNLKSKKSQSKLPKGKKETQPFEFQDFERDDQKELLCNRMLLMKKIEKYEKEAISCFYDKDYGKCFVQLNKAESLLKKEKIDSPQHQLYINYLYAEFCFKLEKHEKWKLYLVRAKSFIHRIEGKQQKQMREYILNLKALDACLALHEQQFQRVLEIASQLKKQDHLSSKIRRRIAGVEISALRKLCKYKEALSAIDQECETLETDPDVNDQKKDCELGRYLEAKIQITSEYFSTESAISLVQEIISFSQVSSGQRESFTYYNPKIFNIYSELLKKLENQKIKLIFFLEKWVEVQTSKKQKLKIQLNLFQMLYEMGIYERALELFDSISCENVVYLGPEYLFMFASIKHFNGEEKQAISIMTKSIDICEDEASKALHMYRLLEFDLDEEEMENRYDRQQMLQEFLHSCQPQAVQHVTNLYVEYLRSRNEHQRLDIFMNRLKKTGQFKSMSFREGRSCSKSGVKRGQK